MLALFRSTLECKGWFALQSSYSGETLDLQSLFWLPRSSVALTVANHSFNSIPPLKSSDQKWSPLLDGLCTQWTHELICSGLSTPRVEMQLVQSGPSRLLGKCATFRRSRVLSLLCTCADNHPLVWLCVWLCANASRFECLRACARVCTLERHDVHLCLHQPACECVCVRVRQTGCVWLPVCVSCRTLSSWNTKQISSMW